MPISSQRTYNVPGAKSMYQGVGKFIQSGSSPFAKFSGGLSKGLGKVNLAMSLYDLTKLGSKNFAGQASSVLGTVGGMAQMGMLSIIPSPLTPFILAGSLLTGLFGGSAKHGLRGR